VRFELAGVCGGDETTAGSDEELDFQLLGQPAQLHADRGRRDVQTLRRLRHRWRIEHRQEQFEWSRLHSCRVAAS
jgi:hypothetical protein